MALTRTAEFFLLRKAFTLAILLAILNKTGYKSKKSERTNFFSH